MILFGEHWIMLRLHVSHRDLYSRSGEKQHQLLTDQSSGMNVVCKIVLRPLLTQVTGE